MEQILVTLLRNRGIHISIFFSSVFQVNSIILTAELKVLFINCSIYTWSDDLAIKSMDQLPYLDIFTLFTISEFISSGLIIIRIMTTP